MGMEKQSYSCRQDDIHRDEVAMILKKGVEKSLMERQSINERIIKARFYSKPAKLTIIQCYEQTNEANDDIQDSFYQRFEKAVDEIPDQDVLYVHDVLRPIRETLKGNPNATFFFFLESFGKKKLSSSKTVINDFQ